MGSTSDLRVLDGQNPTVQRDVLSGHVLALVADHVKDGVTALFVCDYRA